jgi:hypothetical protein
MYSDCASGPVSGQIQKNGAGPSNLTFVLRSSNFYGQAQNAFGIMPGARSPFRALLVRGNPDVIQANVNGTTIQFEGRVTGPDLQQSVYIYRWTNKLSKDTLSGSWLKLGRLVVESCDHLLLGTETTATVTCKTHVKLTKDAEAIFGSRSTDQSMGATFGKQPDGTWIGTQITYRPPTYDISQ